MIALVWFTRDLRLHDHPALRTAEGWADAVVPVFCFDDRLLGGRHASGPRTQFMLECLADLDERLDGRLVFRHGSPETELPALARESGASELHYSADSGPFARRRIARVERALRGAGVECFAHPGLHAVDDLDSIRTQQGNPYTVFSPFHKTWLQAPRREVLGRPRAFGELPARVRKGRLPSLASLGLEQEVEDPLPGGETHARERLTRFLNDCLGAYTDNHDALGRDRTSRLSPYLHFGCLSPREIEERLPDGEGADAFRRQLCWRDFYHHVLLHHPRNARSEFQDRYRGSISWSSAEKKFDAWCEGRTGFPLVDAGMRQLRREGWMHNRARLVVGSFLTKDLGIDWRRGERWFMRWLIDGDEANNNGNWQWIASVGVDPQPFFRRIYNPVRHMERYDPDGRYVRRYVPELRRVPDDYLREPWRMPDDVQRECGCVIGQDYPEPIVDHLEARREAFERYGAA
ncbi:MAG TPA: deoxyribodipyrimidine photo-lyase [Thermoleophilaceae bacterium]|nr:deoxyribodipyrimidine photo-lyase [Thermoleophilaceae bacterium]